MPTTIIPPAMARFHHAPVIAIIMLATNNEANNTKMNQSTILFMTYVFLFLFFIFVYVNVP